MFYIYSRFVVVLVTSSSLTKLANGIELDKMDYICECSEREMYNSYSTPNCKW